MPGRGRFWYMPSSMPSSSTLPRVGWQAGIRRGRQAASRTGESTGGSAGSRTPSRRVPRTTPAARRFEITNGQMLGIDRGWRTERKTLASWCPAVRLAGTRGSGSARCREDAPRAAMPSVLNPSRAGTSELCSKTLSSMRYQCSRMKSSASTAPSTQFPMSPRRRAAGTLGDSPGGTLTVADRRQARVLATACLTGAIRSPARDGRDGPIRDGTSPSATDVARTPGPGVAVARSTRRGTPIPYGSLCKDGRGRPRPRRVCCESGAAGWSTARQFKSFRALHRQIAAEFVLREPRRTETGCRDGPCRGVRGGGSRCGRRRPDSGRCPVRAAPVSRS